MTEAIQELNTEAIDREYLFDLIESPQDHIEIPLDASDGWLEAQLRMAREMLLHGLVDTFGITRSGRPKTSRAANKDRTGMMANHLNTSKDPGKHGYAAVWKAIQQGISTLVDIRSAKPLISAICTGDENLFYAYLKGDVYEKAVIDLSLPEIFQSRKMVKNKLWLPIQYGCSLKTVLESKKSKGLSQTEHQQRIDDTRKAYTMLREYLQEQYPVFWEGRKQLIKRSYAVVHKEKFPYLPNGVRLRLDPNKPYAIVPILMQSYVSLLTTKMFNQLWESGYKPVFDIHDAVITRKPIEFEEANPIMRGAVQNLIDRHGLDWQIPHGVRLVTTDPIMNEQEFEAFSDEKSVVMV